MNEIEKVKERWAMMRWVTEFIEENSEKWEKERNIRLEKERKELLDWEKSSRFEKIKKLKEKWSKEKQETMKNTQQNNKNENKTNIKTKKFVPPGQGRSNTWSQWREYKGKSKFYTTKISRIPPPLATKTPSTKPAAKLKIKLHPSKLFKTDNKQEKQQAVAIDKTCQTPITLCTKNKPN